MRLVVCVPQLLLHPRYCRGHQKAGEEIMEDLIKRLDCVRFQPFDGVVVYRDEDGNEETLWDVITSAIDTIESLVSENNRLKIESKREVVNPQWIPVTELLPEEHDSIFNLFHGTPRWTKEMFRTLSDIVLVVIVFEDGSKAVKFANTEDGKWNIRKYYRAQEVTHWMPLPEPPAT